MSIATLRKATHEVQRATDFFALCIESSPSPQALKKRYRDFAKTLHPDTYPVGIDDAVQQQASAAYQRLTELYTQALEEVSGRSHCSASPRKVIATKRGSHEVGGSGPRGDMTVTFLATSTLAGVSRPSFVKMARYPTDNDLLKTEGSILSAFGGAVKIEQYRAFVPELLDQFTADNNGQRCQANVIARLDGFVSLADVIKAFPSGVPALDMTWMWRRLLVALGFAHSNGVIHGAVLPQNVMIHPAKHGLVLVDWCYASRRDGVDFAPIQAIVGDARDWYPPEVFAKQPPSASVDLAMAARVMVALLGGDPISGRLSSSVPRPYRAFFRGCLAPVQAARPQDAWLLLQEFDELLEALGRPFYPRRFRQFTMPRGIA